MDHVVYLDAQADELENLLAGEKTMIVRGAAGRKLPYGRVNHGDILYFLNNDGKGLVQARAKVCQILNSEPLTSEASQKLLANHQSALKLTKKTATTLERQAIPGIDNGRGDSETGTLPNRQKWLWQHGRLAACR